jgi:shikimate kinase
MSDTDQGAFSVCDKTHCISQITNSLILELINNRIIITGFMGAGKTTVGRALAKKLDCTFLDLDDAVLSREGRTAQQIIDEDGEERFRECETVVLGEILSKDDVKVIALGGGAWAIEQNRKLIDESKAMTLWLSVPFDICWQRIALTGESRPFARDEDQARQRFEDRGRYYRSTELHLELLGNESVNDICDEIVRRLGT